MKECKEISLLIKCINESIEKNINAKLKKYNLTISQVRIIKYVNKRQEQGIKTSQKNIEDYFGISHPTTVGLIKRLESKGFVRCEFDCEDRRVKNIYITEMKEKLKQDMGNFIQEIDLDINKNISEEEQKQVLYILEKIYKGMKK